MTFFGKRVTQLTPEDIYWLVKARVQEGSDIEFKRALAARDGADDRWVVQGDSIGDHAKRDLIKEIVGFANSRGGTLLLGIKEGKEKPSRAEAITLIPRVAELVAWSPEVRPGLSFESGYFQSLERRRGHGTEGTIDRGDHLGAA